MTAKLRRDTKASLLLNLKEAQALLGIGDRYWRELEAMGQAPAPVALPGRPRWRRSDLLRWAAELGTRAR